MSVTAFDFSLMMVVVNVACCCFQVFGCHVSLFVRCWRGCVRVWVSEGVGEGMNMGVGRLWVWVRMWSRIRP